MLPNTLLGSIFALRGHVEFIHTRRPRESDPKLAEHLFPARAIVGDTVLFNGILKRLGAFAEKLSSAANLVVQMVVSLGKDSVLLAASVAPLPWSR